MKETILSFLLCATAINIAFSQNYQAIEWDILGINKLMPVEENATSSNGLYTEARYNMNDRISIGLKYELQFFGELYFNEPLRGLGITSAVSLTGDYYISNKINKRFFTGLAIGKFNNTATTESGKEVGSSGFGIKPRIGYEFYFLRITAEYNHTFEEDFPNYFSLGVGINIGGRYKES